MSEIRESAKEVAQAEELDDFDVEGHGLKEVALGLSAATMVASGAGAAALALDNPAPGTTAGAQAAVAGVHGDVTDRLGWIDRTAQDAVGDATSLVGQVSSTAVTTAQPVVQQATGLAGEAVTLAADVAHDPIGTSDRLVDEAVDTTREVRDGALTTAQQVVADTVVRVDSTVGAASELAGSTVEQAGDLAVSTAGSAYGVVDPSVQVESQDDGSTAVTAQVAGKTIKVHAG